MNIITEANNRKKALNILENIIRQLINSHFPYNEIMTYEEMEMSFNDFKKEAYTLKILNYYVKSVRMWICSDNLSIQIYIKHQSRDTEEHGLNFKIRRC